jgi:hypothetical protein
MNLNVLNDFILMASVDQGSKSPGFGFKSESNGGQPWRL